MEWQVQTPARLIASSTTFDRIAQEPAYAYAEPVWPYWAGYGPYWWYDPLYPSAVFVHSRPVFHARGRVFVDHFDGRFAPGHVHVAGRGFRHR